MDDHNVEYHIECVHCGTVYYVSYDNMVDDDWKVLYQRGFVCPCCTRHYPNAVSMTEAQENRRHNKWSSLIRP